MNSNETLKTTVLKKLNDQLGTELEELTKYEELYNGLLNQKQQVQVQLNLSNENSYIGKVLNESETIVEQTRESIGNAEKTIDKIEQSLDEIEKVRGTVQEKYNELNKVQTTLQYFKVIKQIEHLSDQLEKEVEKKDDEQCATLFANLCEISRNLTDLPKCHLREHLRDTLHYWHNILKEKLSKDLDDILKAIKWPFVNANFSLALPLPVNVQKLQLITEYLLQIEIPSECSLPIVTSPLLSEFPPLCLPIQLMIQPLKKRFLYHFYGARQTNRVDKPEWYFTQILAWIRDHRDFVEKWIQPVIDKLGLHHIDAKLELTRGLVELAVEKLNSDLPNLQYDDFTFSHTVDEALGFDKELRELYNYPQNQPTILAVLTQAQVFMKWISMEKKYATEKMDAILPPNNLEAFEPLASDVENLKITNCADAFITLLQTITERYESLPQPGHRLQFLELQLELLDDFRVRLLQLINAEEGNAVESKLPMIANSIYYIENVLIDWGAMLHFLNLYYYKSQLVGYENEQVQDFDDSETETETVFADTLSLYKHLRKDLLCTLAEYVMAEIKNSSYKYRTDPWFTMVVQKDFKSLSLTPNACPMFEVIGKRLHILQKALEQKLFTSVWRTIAKQLDDFLFEDLIFFTRFSEGGALQLKFDITRNLLPLFSQFSERPENYFIQIIEACNLLNISKGSALLLRETLLALEGTTGVEDTRGRALKEVGVANLSPLLSVKVLNQRADITYKRTEVD